MSYIPHGMHLVAGDWNATDKTFRAEPATGQAYDYSVGTVGLVDSACEAAEAAFWTYGQMSRERRAEFLDAIADEIDARTVDIAQMGSAETGLPMARLEGERGRTTMQLRLFASHIRAGEYLDRRADEAIPTRTPVPRPEIRLIEQPIGPVAVFGASNFPLAFSTAGGDTAAALAAGCPVVVKGHSAHPGTNEIVATAVLAAIKRCAMPAGVFNLIQGGDRTVGQALVQHPRICAVGFTGSLAGGRSLFDLCAARSNPIPFFGELGSVNPMFVLPEAGFTRAQLIGTGWAASLSLGAGQFCTNPGICVVLDGAAADALAAAAVEALQKVGPQMMLTSGIARSYQAGVDRLKSRNSVRPLFIGPQEGRKAGPALFETEFDSFVADHVLHEEVFGACGLIVRVNSVDQMARLARDLQGQLTITLHCDPADRPSALALRPILERKAGRVLVNGFPTGVEVVDSMVHGGPYPASTNFGATSVGTLSIRRFLRPVAYQNFPADLLPEDLTG